MRFPDDSRRGLRERIAEWTADDAQKWAWLGLGGSVSVVAVLIALETLARWAWALVTLVWGAF